jgi:hypothetical protein
MIDHSIDFLLNNVTFLNAIYILLLLLIFYIIIKFIYLSYNQYIRYKYKKNYFKIIQKETKYLSKFTITTQKIFNFLKYPTIGMVFITIIFFIYPFINSIIKQINIKYKIENIYYKINNDPDLNLTFAQYFNTNNSIDNQQQIHTDALLSKKEMHNESYILSKVVKKKFPNANNEDIIVIYEYAKKLNIDIMYLYAIVATESGFRRYAISKDKAYGLFQVRINSAKEALDRYYTTNRKLTTKDLLNPKINIPLGIGYIKLLKDYHFRFIEDERKKFLLTTYAYIGGIGRILKIFQEGSIKNFDNQKNAQKIINNMSLEKMEDKIVNHLINIGFEDTLNYPKKVYSYMSNFKKEYSNF